MVSEGCAGDFGEGLKMFEGKTVGRCIGSLSSNKYLIPLHKANNDGTLLSHSGSNPLIKLL